MPMSMTLDSINGTQVRAEFYPGTICYGCAFVAFVGVLGQGAYNYRLFGDGTMKPGSLSRPKSRAEDVRYPKCWVNTTRAPIKVIAIRNKKVVGRSTIEPGEKVLYADDCELEIIQTQPKEAT
jgi:hypothetical protein